MASSFHAPAAVASGPLLAAALRWHPLRMEDQHDASIAYRTLRWRLDGLQARLFQLAWALFLSPLVFAPLAAVLGVFRVAMSGLTTAAFLVAPVVALLGALVEVEWPWPLMQGGRASVVDDVLILARKKKVERISRKKLRAAWVHQGGLELETTEGNLLQMGMDLGEARRLLAELGLDARRRTLQLRLGPSDFLTAMTILLGPAVAYWLVLGLLGLLDVPRGDTFSSAIFYLTPLLFFALRGAVQAFLGPARLTIGADGVQIRQDLRTRFLPFSRMRDWRVEASGVTFLLRDGRSVKARGRHLMLDGKASAVAERLEEARRLHLPGEERAEARALLARRARAPGEWKKELEQLLTRGDYRESPVQEEELKAILESPEEAPELRLGAALALRGRAPAEVRGKLRAAAEVCANPRLRVAFEAIARGKDEDEALLAALDEQEKQERRGRAG